MSHKILMVSRQTLIETWSKGGNMSAAQCGLTGTGTRSAVLSFGGGASSLLKKKYRRIR